MRNLLLSMLFLLLISSYLLAEELLTQSDISKAELFAKKYYPIPTGTNTWIIIDENDQSLTSFLFTDIRINQSTSNNSPCCFLGKQNDKWFLLIDESTFKEIELPQGFDLNFILGTDAYVVSSIEKKKIFKLYQPSTKKFPAEENLVSGFLDEIILTNPNTVIKKESDDLQTMLFDNNCSLIFKSPIVINNRFLKFKLLGEGIIGNESTPIVNGKIFKDAKDNKVTLFNHNMKKIADLPNGWTFFGNYNNGISVFITKIDRYTDPVQFAFINKNGKILFKTNKEIISGQKGTSGIFRFRDLKTFLEGYIDQSGKVILPAKYEQTTNFINGKAFVTEREKVGFEKEENDIKCYEIDALGNRIREIKIGFDILPLLHRGFGISVNRDKPGLYKLDGTPIWTTDNEKIINRCFNFYQQFISE